MNTISPHVGEIITVLFLICSGAYGFFRILIGIASNNSKAVKLALSFLALVILGAVAATVYFR